MTKRRSRISYSKAELAWLEARRDQPRQKLHADFVKKFSRNDVEFDHIKGLMTRRGWASSKHRFSKRELDWIKANATLPVRELHRRFVAKFNRPKTTVSSLVNARCRRGWLTGRKGGEGLVNSGAFKPGNVPANKGMPMSPERRAKAEPTMFKKGHRPANKKHIGHERVCQKDGYVLICVPGPSPYKSQAGKTSHYVHKHRWLWEQKHGPVPKGMVLKSLDGDKTNTDPDNWVALERGMLPRLNGVSGRDYDSAPAHLKPLILQSAKLAHAACKAQKGIASTDG